jgi:hypothetical protein
MSLSARIALDPSHRVAMAEMIVPIVGVAVATAALASRWPVMAGGLVACATISMAFLSAHQAVRRRRLRRYTITVAASPEIGVLDALAADAVDTGRLVDSTLFWPGFAVLAIARDDGRTVRLPVVVAELPPVERRALARFLMWSQRARGGKPGARERKGP